MGRKLLWWCLPPVLLMTMLLCVCAGSVPLSPGETLQILWRGLTGTEAGGSGEAIILRVRLPRVLCVALTGASLSLCGAAMQGLLRNPLADGSTLGVSSGASLGAVLAIVLGMQFPGLPFAGTMVMAMLFAFGSLALILTLAYALDRSLADNLHDWASVKARVREALSSYIYRRTKRSPMILPILLEV